MTLQSVRELPIMDQRRECGRWDSDRGEFGALTKLSQADPPNSITLLLPQPHPPQQP